MAKMDIYDRTAVISIIHKMCIISLNIYRKEILHTIEPLSYTAEAERRITFVLKSG